MRLLRMAAVACGALALVGMTALTAPGAMAATRDCHCTPVTSITPPPATDGPFNVTEGPGGTWYAEGDTIVRVRPNGVQDQFALPNPDTADAGWLAWSGGSRVWFADRGGRIGSIDAHGTVVEYPVPPDADGNAGPNGLVIDGNTVWFTDPPSNRIGRLDIHSGHITMYAVPTADSWPLGITLGPDHALWFTERNAGQLGRITVHGAFKEWALDPDSFPNRITVGSDGAIWFTELHTSMIGRMSMSWHLTETPIDGGPVGITRAPDGHLYVALYASSQLARLDWSGHVTKTWDVPGALLVAASQGALWLTSPFTNSVTEVDVYCDN